MESTFFAGHGKLNPIFMFKCIVFGKLNDLFIEKKVYLLAHISNAMFIRR